MVKKKQSRIATETTSNLDEHFPCDFPIKVFGSTGDQFEITVLSIIRKHIPNLREDAIRNRSSKNSKYTALTILVHVDTKAQLDAIYQDLTKNPHVLMAL